MTKYKQFAYQIPGDPELAELNGFMGSHKVVKVNQYTTRSEGVAYLVFVVEYREGPSFDRRSEKQPKKDYKEILTEEEFPRYLRLKEVRKAIADEADAPLYNIFNNDQLAAIVQERVVDLSDLAKMKKMGKTRVEKYGERILAAHRECLEDKKKPEEEA